MYDDKFISKDDLFLELSTTYLYDRGIPMQKNFNYLKSVNANLALLPLDMGNSNES